MVWKKLPIEGFIVDAITVFGNGKRCYVTIKTANPRKEVGFMMYNPSLEIELQGKVKTVVFSDGHETRLGTKYIPQEELLLETCAIDYPGEEESWDTALIDYEKGHSDFIGWTIYHAKLRLSPSGNAALATA